MHIIIIKLKGNSSNPITSRHPFTVKEFLPLKGVFYKAKGKRVIKCCVMIEMPLFVILVFPEEITHIWCADGLLIKTRATEK